MNWKQFKGCKEEEEEEIKWFDFRNAYTHTERLVSETIEWLILWLNRKVDLMSFGCVCVCVEWFVMRVDGKRRRKKKEVWEKFVCSRRGVGEEGESGLGQSILKSNRPKVLWIDNWHPRDRFEGWQKRNRHAGRKKLNKHLQTLFAKWHKVQAHLKIHNYF